MVRVGDVARTLEEHFPLSYAVAGDNCGLQIGSRSGRVRAVLVALDPSVEAVRRAAARGAQLLVTHHPLFHEPLRSIEIDRPEGAAAAAALAGGIAVYAAHTNLDAAPGGLAQDMARRLGIQDGRAFGSTAAKGRCKLVVFVPPGAAGAVHRAMAGAGAGKIGRYDHCAFATDGTGMFRPLEGSAPAAGRVGRLEKTPEVRLEMVVNEEDWPAAVERARSVHPYEEMAWDLYPLQPRAGGGLGCIGVIATEAFGALAARAGRAFGAEARIMGAPPRRVRTVACVPGSGGGLLAAAARRGAQVLVTGEVRYHQATEAEHLGMGIVELGHDRSEMPGVDLLAAALGKDARLKKAGLKVHVYRRPRTVRLR